MKYVLGLKEEINLLDEDTAKKRYHELLSMGYSKTDVVFATPVPVENYFNIEQSTVASSQSSSNPVNELDKGIGSDFNGTQYTNVSGLNFGGEELPSDTLS